MKLRIYFLIPLLTSLCLSSFAVDFTYHNSQDQTKDTASAIEILTDSTLNYAYGNACGFAGIPPRGKLAIDELLRTKDYKGIKSILDGHNNEGKVYAIEALLRLGKNGITLSKQDKFKIKSFVEQNIGISQCNGCMYSIVNTLLLFKSPYFVGLFKQNGIQIESN